MAGLYPKDIESKIGFDSIRHNIISRCQSVMGVGEVEAMAFISSYPLIKKMLLQTLEMKKIYEGNISQPEVSFNELASWLPALRVPGNYAAIDQYQQLRKSLISFEKVREYFSRREGNDEDTPYVFPSLAELFLRLKNFPNLIINIEKIIDKNGGVKDSASPELAEVRQKLYSLQGSVSRTLQRIFDKAVKEGIVDKDTAPSIRDGRVVIPVPAPNKRNINGIIHDESATGKTVFIEPAETVEISNRIRELENEEKRIIIRLLIELADQVRPCIEEIIENNSLLGKLDFIMAKARFALDIGGEMPILSQKPEIDWYGAVHPVLLQSLKSQGKSIVPLNIRLEGKKRILIISGPNAGGKSVALKTIGIVQYMCQCGILPPLHSNSHVGIFDKIFIDIGDEQSLENDLSTYSSHLKNMRYFLLHADKRTLILIDEIGSGTEPNIGASLAKSILAELAKSRCFGIVTTHYHNLKRFAEEDESFINGAMLYDRQKLQPTFQLSVGNAGSSFALEIAGKIGLPKNIIESAKQEVGEDYVESDRFMMEIARDRKYWQAKRVSIKEKESRLMKLEEKYEKLIEEINTKRKEVLREAQEEARQMLAGTNKKIENTIAEIRKIEAEKERTKVLRKELETFKEEIEQNPDKNTKFLNLTPKLSKKKKNLQESKRQIETEKTRKVEKINEISPGAYVKMSGTNTVGQILNISGKEAEVAFGSLRTRIKLSKLTLTDKPISVSRSEGYAVINKGTSDESRRRQLEFRDEIDIRGKRADEALDEVIHFIDDALQFGIKKVRILHGTGGGILRQLVRQQLNVTPGVLKYEDEDVRLGGTGITVVTMK